MRVSDERAIAKAEIDALVDEYRRTINAVVLSSELFVSGSTLLGYYGGHDVDLVVLVPDVAEAARRLRALYPTLYEDEWRVDWAAFRDPGPPQVDIVLTSPGTKGDAHHRRAWQLLLADKALRAEYLELKEAGMSGAQKAAFFDRVVSLLDDPGTPG
jgi:hypothetical protein